MLGTEMPYSKGWHHIRQKPSGKWEARWADEHGEARGKCWGTKAQARKYARDMANNIGDAAVGIDVLRKPLGDAVQNWLDTVTDEGTLSIYTRHINWFRTQMPDVRFVSSLSEEVIFAYDKKLVELEESKGYRRLRLRVLKTFCLWAVEKDWLRKTPFRKFKLPVSDFEGRYVPPDEFALLSSVGDNKKIRYDVDKHLRDALIIMREQMWRTRTVWQMRPEDYKDGQIRIPEIKDQPAVWVPLRPAALEIIRRRIAAARSGERLFQYWKSPDAMRQSLRKKKKRIGLAKPVRFHDAGKVSRVTELDAMGKGIGVIAELSNTSKGTLVAHYIKADRRKAFEEYMTLDLPWTGNPKKETVSGPETGPNMSKETQPAPMIATSSQNEE